jgi:hypothetical protein
VAVVYFASGITPEQVARVNLVDDVFQIRVHTIGDDDIAALLERPEVSPTTIRDGCRLCCANSTALASPTYPVPTTVMLFMQV